MKQSANLFAALNKIPVFIGEMDMCAKDNRFADNTTGS
jgi:hypothetical protein